VSANNLPVEVDFSSIVMLKWSINNTAFQSKADLYPRTDRIRRHAFLFLWPWPWSDDLDMRTWLRYPEAETAYQK